MEKRRSIAPPKRTQSPLPEWTFNFPLSLEQKKYNHSKSNLKPPLAPSLAGVSFVKSERKITPVTHFSKNLTLLGWMKAGLSSQTMPAL